VRRVLRNFFKSPFALLAVVEALLLCVPIYAAALLRFGGDLTQFDENFGALFPRSALFAVVLLASLLAVGLYSPRQRARFDGVLARLIVAFAGGGIGLMVLFYLFPSLHLWRGLLGYAAVVAFVMICAVRLILPWVVNGDVFRRRVVFLGAGRRAGRLMRLRRRTDQRGFKVVGFIAVAGDEMSVDPAKLLTQEGSLLDFATALDVDEVVIAMDDRRRNLPLDQLLACRLGGIEVIDLVQFLERETGTVDVSLVSPSYLILGPGFSRTPLRLLSARIFDLCASALLVVLSSPFMVVAAIAILLEDGRPIFYRQTRVGIDRVPFRLTKFRSMRKDAESSGKAQWATAGDDRVTRVGRILRKTRIDELPQLLNVLRGEMSIVGPRPERPEFVDQLAVKIPYYQERLAVKPGLTGWAQLCFPYGSTEGDALEKLQYDLYYVKHHSLLFDLWILLQTAEVVLWQKGAR